MEIAFRKRISTFIILRMNSPPLLTSRAGPQWQRIGVKQHDGVDLPLFSLHTKQSCGIGEYKDLIPMIDWCREIGYDVLQLLPLNDTGPDTSPYSALSAFALNPLFLSLADLPNLSEDLKGLLPPLQDLSKTQRIDYGKVGKGKEQFLRHYYKRMGDSTKSKEQYQQFVRENPWLEAYALFKAIKIKVNWKPWQEWEPEWQNPDEKVYRRLVEQYKDEIAYHIFLQYFCFQQMEEVKAHAEAKGVFLKGDIPILISPESADVWLYGKLFLIYYSAGAPPDMYSKEGQNWKFPIYDWEEMERQNYQWWKLRLQVACRYYHIYRLDHIVGFFRIWAIPQGAQGNQGRFIPEDKSQWIPHGEKIMYMMLDSSPMLPIGEDLGTVPNEVRACLRRLGICGTKVMRWERRWEGDKGFIDGKDYPIESMTTVSTHDSETLTMWWNSETGEVKEYCQFKGWNYSKPLPTKLLYALLKDSHHSASLFHINLLQEYFPLVPGFSWPNPDDERINVPGTISPRNWSYRFRPSVEEIVQNPKLKTIMAELIK